MNKNVVCYISTSVPQMADYVVMVFGCQLNSRYPNNILCLQKTENEQKYTVLQAHREREQNIIIIILPAPIHSVNRRARAIKPIMRNIYFQLVLLKFNGEKKRKNCTPVFRRRARKNNKKTESEYARRCAKEIILLLN